VIGDTAWMLPDTLSMYLEGIVRIQLRMVLSSVVICSAIPLALAGQDTTRVTIEGTVLNVVTGQPVSGAEVSLGEISLRVVSDAGGSFCLPDLVLGTYHLSIRAEGFESIDGDFRVERAGAFTLRLRPLGGGGEAEYGQVRGIVQDRETGEALEGAQVTLPSLSQTTFTGEDGRFSFREVPSGILLLKTEYLGYGTRTDSIMVPPGHLVTVGVELAVAPIELDPIRVEVEPLLLSLALEGFYERRAGTSGIFMTRDQIVAKHPTFTSDIFNNLPGVRTIGSIGLDRAVILRSGARLTLHAPGLCGPTVYLDGMVIERGGPGSPSAFVDRIIRPDQIAGIEVYTSPATVPLQYKGVGSDCGVIVFWSR